MDYEDKKPDNEGMKWYVVMLIVIGCVAGVGGIVSGVVYWRRGRLLARSRGQVGSLLGSQEDRI